MKDIYNHIVEQITPDFQPVSLKEMDCIRLMNRKDTKFIFHINQLPAILNKAKDYYSILEINNKRISAYKSIYYDTHDKHLFLAHQNGKSNRFKIRQREYMDSKECFIEIKLKTNKNRTVKSRTKIKRLDETLSDKAKQFIQNKTKVSADELEIAITNYFDRMTLASINNNERITIDINLKFNKDKKNIEMPFLVIAEIKQDVYSNSSELYKILKNHRIYPSGMSKYCIGLIKFDKSLKYNNFKTKLLKLNKIENEQYIA